MAWSVQSREYVVNLGASRYFAWRQYLYVEGLLLMLHPRIAAGYVMASRWMSQLPDDALPQETRVCIAARRPPEAGGFNNLRLPGGFIDGVIWNQ